MKNSPAFFIGRFQPFHLGHLDAIKQILTQYPKIIIGIGSAQYSNQVENPFSADLRQKMIKESLVENGITGAKFFVVQIPDIHDDKLWVAHCENLAPKFGAVFSGTQKVRALFALDGRHEVFEPKFNLDISGTLIRSLIKEKKDWSKFVPKSVFKLLQNN